LSECRAEQREHSAETRADEGSGVGCSARAETEAAAADGWHWVPDAVIAQWGEVLDIVQPGSRRCNCFTRTYSRYTKVLKTPESHLLLLRQGSQKPLLAASICLPCSYAYLALLSDMISRAKL
jgi:hypothetical protein